jgi:endonuclease YncB( thermonuclease family)
MSLRRLILLAGLLVASPAAAETTATFFGPGRALEGDRLEVDGRVVRLWGIDAPELRQSCVRAGAFWPCGRKAYEHLAAFLDGQIVTCRVMPESVPSRTVAKCAVQGLDVAAELATRGFAMVPPNGTQYCIPNRNEGRTRGAGLWSGVYVNPWEWRQGKRVVEWINDLRGCAVKGDIDDAGARIFYLPFHRRYETIRIEVAKGERWFCVEEEARAAGWRDAAE